MNLNTLNRILFVAILKIMCYIRMNITVQLRQKAKAIII